MTQINNNPILGLVGDAAAGKDYVAQVFESNGFIHCSSSDIVREEITKHNLVPNRELQNRVANEVRLSRGGAYFVVGALRRAHELSPGAPVLVSGIYALAEGRYILEELKGDLVYVTTGHRDEEDMDIRFERLKNRDDGSRDRLDFQDFVVAYERENSGSSPFEANIMMLRSIARFTIINTPETDPSKLAEQVDSILNELRYVP